jgi:hypothetical protein
MLLRALQYWHISSQARCVGIEEAINPDLKKRTGLDLW